jgi:hypothetical protein
MAASGSSRQPAAAPGGRYSLRTLFVTSAAVAVPFLLLANLRNAARPDDSLPSPLYLIAGVVTVLVCAAIGNALGRTPGLAGMAVGAAVIWAALVWICSEFSPKLKTLLPVHVAAAAATVVCLVVWVRKHREPTDEGPHPMLARLLAVKSGLKPHPPEEAVKSPTDNREEPKSP